LGIAARRATGFGVEHEREQAQRFRLGGEQVCDYAAEEDGFFGQIAAG